MQRRLSSSAGTINILFATQTTNQHLRGALSVPQRQLWRPTDDTHRLFLFCNLAIFLLATATKHLDCPGSSTGTQKIISTNMQRATFINPPNNVSFFVKPVSCLHPTLILPIKVQEAPTVLKDKTVSVPIVPYRNDLTNHRPKTSTRTTTHGCHPRGKLICPGKLLLRGIHIKKVEVLFEC